MRGRIPGVSRLFFRGNKGTTDAEDDVARQPRWDTTEDATYGEETEGQAPPTGQVEVVEGVHGAYPWAQKGRQSYGEA